jgi:hypothetical protein
LTETHEPASGLYIYRRYAVLVQRQNPDLSILH